MLRKQNWLSSSAKRLLDLRKCGIFEVHQDRDKEQREISEWPWHMFLWIWGAYLNSAKDYSKVVLLRGVGHWLQQPMDVRLVWDTSCFWEEAVIIASQHSPSDPRRGQRHRGPKSLCQDVWKLHRGQEAAGSIQTENRMQGGIKGVGGIFWNAALE